MKQDKVLQVCYEDQTVGTLAMTADHKVAFQYRIFDQPIFIAFAKTGICSS